MKNTAILSAVLALSAGTVLAEGSDAYWGKVDGTIGMFQFDADNVDTDDVTPSHAGIALSFGGQSAAGLTGSLDFVSESLVSEATDGDTTVQTLMVGGHLGWALSDGLVVGAIAGAGQTQDNGDNDDGPVPFNFAGAEGSYMANGATYFGQVGVLRSSDTHGETVQDGRFMRAGAWFALADNVNIGLEFSRLIGERWNDTDPTDGTIDMRAAAILFEAQSKSMPLSYWASLDAYDYQTTNETDSPWVTEIRVGVTYHFGSGGSRRPASSGLPRINRWIATSANEIE